LSARHNLELGGVAAPSSVEKKRIKALVERFPVLGKKADQQASTLFGGEQKLLEIARASFSTPSSC
jgi:branched-chain amino acid transport system ATP-binding protein